MSFFANEIIYLEQKRDSLQSSCLKMASKQEWCIRESVEVEQTLQNRSSCTMDVYEEAQLLTKQSMTMQGLCLAAALAMVYFDANSLQPSQSLLFTTILLIDTYQVPPIYISSVKPQRRNVCCAAVSFFFLLHHSAVNF